MVLDNATSKKIISFVQTKPRTIQEIAHLLQRNWRTADSYVQKIASEQGVLATRVFRGGTPGALKIVYYQEINKISSSGFQEKLLRKIESAQNKNEFSPFDIYQYVNKERRKAFLERQTEYRITSKQNMLDALRSAEKTVMIFSGNLSWAVASEGKTPLMSVFEELAQRGVQVRVICRVDVESQENIKKFLSLNDALGKEFIQIRHAEQPLRAFMIDDKFVRFKEQKMRNTYIFYELWEDEWLSWIEKVFWHFFHNSIKAEKRLADIESIEQMS